MTKIADKITKKDASGNYDVMGWMPGGPAAGGNPGAFDQGWHYTWGFVNGGKFADLTPCKVTPTDPGVVAGYQFMYDWAKAHDPAGDRPLGHDEPARQIPGRPEPVLDRQAGHDDQR